jgi:putative PIN family toxin of toxin-antitoxin system
MNNNICISIWEIRVFICPFIVGEFERILSKKIKASNAEVKSATELVLEAAKPLPAPGRETKGVSRDPDDDNVLDCAVAAKAGYLVTGDSDLLVLKSHKVVKIIPPRDFELLFND